MKSVICFIFLALVCAPALQAFDVASGIKAICQRQKDFHLRKISEVQSIINELEHNPSSGADCAPEIVAGILDMKPIVSEGIDDVCNSEKADQIRDYYAAHIYTGDDKSGSHVKLPDALKSFFVAFGFKVNALCKKNMINSILYETKNILDENDRKSMAEWSSRESFLNELIKGPNDFDDIVLASELSMLKESEDDEDDSMMYVKLATGNTVRKIQVTCARRFEPIYSQLITPLVSLANIGFSYQGEDLALELKELSTNEDIHNWYKVVYLCDSVNRIVILDQTPEDQKEGEASSAVGDSKVIHVYTEQEAKALGTSGDSLESLFPEIKPIEFTPSKNSIEDEILPEDDKQFFKLVSSFKSDSGVLDRIRKRVIKVVGNFVKNALKKGQINIVSSIFGGNKDKRNTKQDVVNAIDSYLEKSSEMSIDQPVSGLLHEVGGFGKRAYHNGRYHGITGLAIKGKNKTKHLLSGRSNFNKWLWRGIMLCIVIAITVPLLMTVMG